MSTKKAASKKAARKTKPSAADAPAEQPTETADLQLSPVRDVPSEPPPFTEHLPEVAGYNDAPPAVNPNTFTIVLERVGSLVFATCNEIAGSQTEGESVQDALQRIGRVIEAHEPERGGE